MASGNSFVYVFVDESGDLGRHGSPYFIIACLSTMDVRSVEKITKRVRERKLKKKKRDVPELKANSSSPRIREAVLRELAKCDCGIDLIIIDKNKVKDHLYEAKNKLYNYVLGLLIEELDLRKTGIEIIIDKKDSNRLLREDLDQYIRRKIKENHGCDKVEITHLASHAHKALQVIDFVAWAANRKYSFGDDGYFKIIEPKIRTLKKLWSG